MESFINLFIIYLFDDLFLIFIIERFTYLFFYLYIIYL